MKTVAGAFPPLLSIFFDSFFASERALRHENIVSRLFIGKRAQGTRGRLVFSFSARGYEKKPATAIGIYVADRDTRFPVTRCLIDSLKIFFSSLGVISNMYRTCPEIVLPLFAARRCNASYVLILSVTTRYFALSIPVYYRISNVRSTLGEPETRDCFGGG